MEMDKLGLASASGCLASLPSEAGAVASVAPGPTSGSTGAVSAFQRRVDSKKNAKKRHSFTALSVTHKSTQASGHRRSMEISAPVLISSSDPRAAARIGDLVHLSRSAPAQVMPQPATWGPSAAPLTSLPQSLDGHEKARHLCLVGPQPQGPQVPVEVSLHLNHSTYTALVDMRDFSGARDSL